MQEKNIIKPQKTISLKNIYRKLLKTPEIGVLVPLIILVLIIGIIQPVFFSLDNLTSIFRKAAFYGIMAIGVSLVIISGSIDISVGSIAGMSSVVSALLMQAGVNPILCIISGLLCAGIIGLCNGFLVAKVKMNGFIVTIGTLYIARGISFSLTGGNIITPLAPGITAIGTARPLGASWSFFIFIFLIIVFEMILRRSTYGRKIYSVGDNSEVASLAGINVDWIKMSTFVISGLFAGLTGILAASQVNTASPYIGRDWELQVVAATAIGGISLLGGVGSMIGTLLGIFVVAVLTNGFIMLRINPQVQTVATGLVMIIAVMVDMIRRRQKLKAD